MELWQIIVIASSAIVLSIVVVLTAILLKRKKINSIVEEFPELLLALGGKENIVSVTSKGSRVNVEVNDKKLVDKEALKLEVETIVVSSKKVTMVTGNDKSIKICDYINKSIVITE